MNDLTEFTQPILISDEKYDIRNFKVTKLSRKVSYLVSTLSFKTQHMKLLLYKQFRTMN